MNRVPVQKLDIRKSQISEIFSNSNMILKSDHKLHKYLRKEGDKYIYANVKHPKFGRGTVTHFDDSKGVVKVSFPDHGEKILLDKFAPLEIDGDSEELIDNIQNENLTTENNKKIATFNKVEIKQQKEKIKNFSKIDGAKIVFSTNKAFKIHKDNKEFWIPKSWVGDISGENLLSIDNRSLKKFNTSFESANSISVPILTDKIKIKKETDKAFLTEIYLKFKDGSEKQIETWFPKSKVQIKDGKLEMDGSFFNEKEKEIKDKYSEIKAPVGSTKETDNAIGYSVSVYENLSEQTVGKMLWFPKSQIKKDSNGDNIIPKWLFDKKVEEIYDSVKHGGWQNSSNSTFEIEGLDSFNKIYPEIVKAYEILDLNGI